MQRSELSELYYIVSTFFDNFDVIVSAIFVSYIFFSFAYLHFFYM